MDRTVLYDEGNWSMAGVLAIFFMRQEGTKIAFTIPADRLIQFGKKEG